MKLCSICNTRHESYQAHVFASNKVTASNNASNAGRDGDGQGKAPGDVDKPVARGLGSTDRADAKGLEFSEARSGERSSDMGAGAVHRRGKKQRWPREAYNAYQREYMRKRRANQS